MCSDTACNLPILILAAGASRRMMGRDKLMEPVDGHPLVKRQVETACSATTGPVFVTLPPAPHPRHDALAHSDARIVPVPDAAEGMSASLRRGLEALPDDAGAVMVLLADLPEITVGDIRMLCQAVQLHPKALIWRGAAQDGRPGHPIIFSRALFAKLCTLSGDMGGAEVVSRNKEKLILVPLPGEHAVKDLDTPHDWDAWRSLRK